MAWWVFLVVMAEWAMLSSCCSTDCCPADCSCNDELLDVHCLHASLEIVPISLNPALQSLVLQYNPLQEVGPASFQFHSELILVDLSFNELARIQDRTFEDQKKLAVLRLAGNQLSQVNNLTFYGLESLRLLDLSGNQISSLPANLFTSMPNLEELYLTHNKLQVLEPSLSGLRRLRRLALGENQLSGLVQVNSTTLAELNVSSNRVSALQLGHLPLLTTLDLSCNPLANLTSSQLPVVPDLPSLTVLNLSGIGLLHVPSWLFLHTPQLRHLLLNGNNFTSIPKGGFQALALLQHLELMNNQQLEQVTDGAFLGLGQLTSLRLAANSRLRNLEPGALQPLVNLRHLDLEGNSLTSIDLDPADRLEVKLGGGNAWNCDCSLHSLQAALISQRIVSSSSVICSRPAGVSLLDANLAACPVANSAASGTQIVSDQQMTVAVVLSVLLVLVLAAAVLLLVRYRRGLHRLLKRLRWGKKKKPPLEGRLEYQRSFIQHEEYFLSLARQQAEYSAANVPVTEL